PISLARKVLESPHVLLVGRGAEQFAQEQGISQCTLEELVTERQYKIWQEQQAQEPQQVQPSDKHGTVGAVALDASGVLAAATSTGGIRNKYPGRVGDSPLVGCGFYADEYAAVSCTGDGEDFVRLLIAKRAADVVGNSKGGQTAREAAEAAIAVLGAKSTGTGGMIVVDRKGNVGFAWNSRNMSHAYIIEGMEEPVSGV
ncbi:MAG: isoaspartyl peptidase/L-asparaginase, partial [Chloroflexi bacterium]